VFNPSAQRAIVRLVGSCLLGMALMLAAWIAPASAIAPDVILRLSQVTIFNVPGGVTRIAVGDGKIVEAKAISNREILLEAKTPGFTNILVWPTPVNGFQPPVLNYNVEVLASRRPETVAVRVRVLDVTRSDLGQLGVDWNDALKFSEAPPNMPFRLGLPLRQSFFEAQVNLLLQNQKARILAQPTLLTTNGASASFLAGGEVPIPLVTQNNVSILWKEFGVKLDVSPTVEGIDTIVLKVRPEVSSLDQAAGVKVGDLNVPGIRTRWTETFMQVRSGESMVMSGLLNDQDVEQIDKFPLLGDVPILGEIFKTRRTTKSRNELVFILTPTLVTGGQAQPEANYGKESK
jgi:pilus assembly protein CpaC